MSRLVHRGLRRIAPSRSRLATMLAAAALLTACGPSSTTSMLTSDRRDHAPGWNGVAVEGEPHLPDAVFTDIEGNAFDLRAALRERPSLVYFGYTHCPDVCPVHLATLTNALEQSSVRPEQINVVFVTVDPARDTPQVLDDYLANFHPSFIGLAADLEDVTAVMRAVGLPEPVLEKPSASGEYTVGHPGQVLAFGRDGRAHLAYPFGTRQSQWVEDLPRLVREDWS